MERERTKMLRVLRAWRSLGEGSKYFEMTSLCGTRSGDASSPDPFLRIPSSVEEARLPHNGRDTCS
jgi:hypothetical protein